MIRTRYHPALAALLAALLCLSPLAPPVMAQGSDANTAVAVNEEDGSSLIDVAFKIRRVSSGVVDQTNEAVAYASCESCQTVAIAIQLVLVSGGADTVAPTNLAVAINDRCTTCQTMALAYQFVFGSGGVVGFTPEGQKRLNEIRKELRGLSKGELTNDEIDARVSDLTAQIDEVLATEVVRRGPARDREDADEGDGDADERREGPREDRTVPQERAPKGQPREKAPEEESMEPRSQPPTSAPTAPPKTTTTPVPPPRGTNAPAPPPPAGSTTP